MHERAGKTLLCYWRMHAAEGDGHGKRCLRGMRQKHHGKLGDGWGSLPGSEPVGYWLRLLLLPSRTERGMRGRSQ